MERSTPIAILLVKKTLAERHRVLINGRAPEDLAGAIAALSGQHPSD